MQPAGMAALAKDLAIVSGLLRGRVGLLRADGAVVRYGSIAPRNPCVRACFVGRRTGLSPSRGGGSRNGRHGGADYSRSAAKSCWRAGWGPIARAVVRPYGRR